MPLLEVLVARERPLTREERESLKQEVEAVFHEVLGTPAGRLRVIVVEDIADTEKPSLPR
ncbi:hypothetical protein [Thermus caldifontis]|uniref:hypothetical protein n=1 Tax=Thermus caldifontis TaxID=1930763 RepID=UPI000DF429AF|nr:hypothetical protein [Thermus caldifontis]